MVLKKWWDSPSWSMGSPVIASLPTMGSCPIPTMFIAFHGVVAPRSSVQKQLRSWQWYSVAPTGGAGETHLAENTVLGNPKEHLFFMPFLCLRGLTAL